MKANFFQLNFYLTEALKRVEPILEENKTTEDVEIDDCIVSRKQLEQLCVCCKMCLSGKDAEIAVPLELIVMDEFWRNFANFLKES